MALSGIVRTFQATFTASLKSTVRFYTLRGFFVIALMNPLFMVATAWVIKNMMAPTGTLLHFARLAGYDDYLAFVVLGFSFNGFLLSTVMRGGSAIYEEQMAGTIELLLLTPANRFAWFLAKSLASMLSNVVDLAVVIAFGYAVFGLRLNLAGGFPTALLGAALTIICLEGFAFLLAGVNMRLKEPHAFEVMLMPVLTLLSGMMFPVEALPEWLRALSYAFPLTHGLNIVRGSLIGGKALAGLAWEFLGLLALLLAYMPVGYFLFKKLEEGAKSSGTLGKY